jgi:hypothetical protein
VGWRRYLSAGFNKWTGRRSAIRNLGLAVGIVIPGGYPVSPSAPGPWTRYLPTFPAHANPAAPFVGMIGDSTSGQLAEPLATVVNRRGVNVVNAAVGGCQPTDLVLTFESPEYFQRHLNCPLDARDKQNEMTARFHPRVIVWSDIMEWSGIKLNNRTIPVGSEEWKRLILDGWTRTLGRLGEAHVVLILPTWWAGWPRDTPAGYPVDRQRSLFRMWAKLHTGRVTVVDLGPVICPAGPPCRQVVGGVQLRTDHVHYTAEGMRRVITKIMADVPVLRDMHGSS